MRLDGQEKCPIGNGGGHYRSGWTGNGGGHYRSKNGQLLSFSDLHGSFSWVVQAVEALFPLRVGPDLYLK